MKSGFNKKSYFNRNHLLIVHIIDFKYLSDNLLLKKRKNDENEQKLLDFISDKEKFKIKPFYDHKEVIDFLSSKLKAMERMDLDDSCIEGKIEIRKIDIDKNIFPKFKQLKNKKNTISHKKRRDDQKHSSKNSKNKSNNKNIIINVNGKIERSSMKSMDLVKDISFRINKEKKVTDLEQLFSGKTLLTTIINEIKGK